MIYKEDGVYHLLLMKFGKWGGYSQLIDKKDIPFIKNRNMVLRFKKDYKRKDSFLGDA